MHVCLIQISGVLEFELAVTETMEPTGGDNTPSSSGTLGQKRPLPAFSAGPGYSGEPNTKRMAQPVTDDAEELALNMCV